MEGVGMPGHFIVRYVPAKGDAKLIDVYEGGKVMTKDEAIKKVEETSGQPFKEEFLAATPKRAIVVRMLHNLLNLARRDDDAPGGLRYLDAILTATPEAVEERLIARAAVGKAATATAPCATWIGCSIINRKASIWSVCASCGARLRYRMRARRRRILNLNRPLAGGNGRVYY